MADMNKVTADYYRRLLEEDTLLPQEDEPIATKVLRTQEEHDFFQKNTGGGPCLCLICGTLKKRST